MPLSLCPLRTSGVDWPYQTRSARLPYLPSAHLDHHIAGAVQGWIVA